MSWGRIDDGLHNHEKFMGLGPVTTPRELWIVALPWTHQNYRRAPHPGFIPAAMPTAWAGTKARGTRLAARLVEAALWEPVEGGWVFHDWLDYAGPDERAHFGAADTADTTGANTAPPDGETLQEKRRRAGKAGGKASGAARRREDPGQNPNGQGATEAPATEARSKPEASASAGRSTSEAPACPPNPVAEPEDLKPTKHFAPPASRSVPRAEARRGEAHEAHVPMALEAQQPGRGGRTPLPAATQAGNALLAEHVAAYRHTPPRDLQRWTSQAIERHLAEGIDPKFVRDGLAAMRAAETEGQNVGPGLLARFIQRAQNPPVRPLAPSAHPGRPQPRSERQADAFAQVRAQMAAEGDQGLQAEFFPFVVDGQVTERRDTA